MTHGVAAALGAWRSSGDCVERLDSCKPQVLNPAYVAASEARLGL